MWHYFALFVKTWSYHAVVLIGRGPWGESFGRGTGAGAGEAAYRRAGDPDEVPLAMAFSRARSAPSAVPSEAALRNRLPAASAKFSSAAFTKPAVNSSRLGK